jgi:hypothetical protein
VDELTQIYEDKKEEMDKKHVEVTKKEDDKEI